MIWESYIGTDFLVPEWICENIIDVGEDEIRKGRSFRMKTDQRNDWSVPLQQAKMYKSSENYIYVQNAIEDCIKEFCEEFTGGRMHVSDYTYDDHKFQKAEANGGFHAWHFESDGQYSNRAFVWMLYLNTVEKGGKTEFHIDKNTIIRVKPEAGKFVFWPAGETHFHRSTPDLQENKYILTGWVCRK